MEWASSWPELTVCCCVCQGGYLHHPKTNSDATFTVTDGYVLRIYLLKIGVLVPEALTKFYNLLRRLILLSVEKYVRR